MFFSLYTIQLTERRQGNTAYRAGKYPAAMHHYKRAQSIIELVRGLSRADQIEVDINRVTTYLNIAAVHMANKEFGAAVESCDKALELDGTNRKALARRARANIGRHEYSTAKDDIAMLQASYPGDGEVDELKRLLAATAKADGRTERATFAGMFDRSTSSLVASSS